MGREARGNGPPVGVMSLAEWVTYAPGGGRRRRCDAQHRCRVSRMLSHHLEYRGILGYQMSQRITVGLAIVL
jgi:hypothetical protein